MKQFPTWAPVLFLLACGGPRPAELRVKVVETGSARPLDSSMVVLFRHFQQAQLTALDTQYTDNQGTCRFRFQPEEGYGYLAGAQRRYYREGLSEDGSAFLNRAAFLPGDTTTLLLQLEALTLPDPGLHARLQARNSAAEVVAALRGNVWRWTLMPNLAWEDIPALLEAAGDTLQIDSFPRNPAASWRPAKVRSGLAALWLAEAVRRQAAAGERALGSLSPPSRAPVLGGRRGNPRGYNSPAEVQMAAEAYRRWWEGAAQAEDRARAARQNPLQGSGLGWL